MKNEKGAITLAICITMLVFSLYGILFYGNSASAYIRQSKTIESIQRVYSKDIDKAYDIAESLK